MGFSFNHLKDQRPSASPDPHPLGAQTATPGPTRHPSAGTQGLSQEGLGGAPSAWAGPRQWGGAWKEVPVPQAGSNSTRSSTAPSDLEMNPQPSAIGAEPAPFLPAPPA